MKAWHKDWTSARRIEKTGFDALEPHGFSGTNRTQPFRLQTLRFFQDTFIPNDQRTFALSPEFFYALVPCLPKVVFNDACLPPLTMHQVADPFRPGPSVFAS